MAPKEIVTVNTPSGLYDGKFLLREFPFYTNKTEGYASFAAGFQDWLARCLGMAPRVLARRSAGKETLTSVRCLEGREKTHTYLQVVACARDAAGVFSLPQARRCGSALHRFHRAGQHYLTEVSSIPEGLQKRSSAVLDDLFSWVGEEFAARHQCKVEQQEFVRLVAECRRQSHDARLAVEQELHSPAALIHGDFSPGNLLVTGVAPKNRTLQDACFRASL